MKFGIVVKKGHKRGEELASKVKPYLKSKSHEVLGENNLKDADYILTFGGDGTLIHTACEYAFLDIPFVGINTGELGFLTSIEADDWQNGLEQLILGKVIISERMTLEAEVKTGNTKHATCYRAVNEVVIKGLYRVIDLDVKVDDERFLKVSGDGVIVATQTGSTAYSLSAGGPIVDPELDCFLVTPINPIALPIPSVVISPKDQIRITIIKGDDISLIIDGQEHTKLRENQRVEVSKGKYNIKFGYFDKHRFIKSLNVKFGLSGRIAS